MLHLCTLWGIQVKTLFISVVPRRQLATCHPAKIPAQVLQLFLADMPYETPFVDPVRPKVNQAGYAANTIDAPRSLVPSEEVKRLPRALFFRAIQSVVYPVQFLPFGTQPWNRCP